MGNKPIKLSEAETQRVGLLRSTNPDVLKFCSLPELEQQLIEFKRMYPSGKVSSPESLQKILKKLRVNHLLFEVVRSDLILDQTQEQSAKQSVQEVKVANLVRLSSPPRPRKGTTVTPEPLSTEQIDRLQKEVLNAHSDISRCLAEMWFDVLDTDGNGSVDFEELVVGLAQFCGPDAATQPEEARARFLFRMYDLDGSGALSKDEFASALRLGIQATANFQLAWSKAVLKEGAPPEMKEVLDLIIHKARWSLKFTLRRQEIIDYMVTDIFEVADENNDGKLTVEEYLAVYRDPIKLRKIKQLGKDRYDERFMNELKNDLNILPIDM